MDHRCRTVGPRPIFVISSHACRRSVCICILAPRCAYYVTRYSQPLEMTWAQTLTNLSRAAMRAYISGFWHTSELLQTSCPSQVQNARDTLDAHASGARTRRCAWWSMPSHNGLRLSSAGVQITHVQGTYPTASILALSALFKLFPEFVVAQVLGSSCIRRCCS